MPSAMTPGAQHRVVVADDDVLVRKGIASVLAEVGYEVIDQVGDAQALLGAVRVRQPDLVVGTSGCYRAHLGGH